MNLQNVEKIKSPPQQKTMSQRFRGKLVATGAAATGAIATTANAAGSVDTLFTQMATDVGGISTGAMSVITILASVLILLLGWGYFKKVK